MYKILDDSPNTGMMRRMLANERSPSASERMQALENRLISKMEEVKKQTRNLPKEIAEELYREMFRRWWKTLVEETDEALEAAKPAEVKLPVTLDDRALRLMVYLRKCILKAGIPETTAQRILEQKETGIRREQWVRRGSAD